LYGTCRLAWGSAKHTEVTRAFCLQGGVRSIDKVRCPYLNHVQNVSGQYTRLPYKTHQSWIPLVKSNALPCRSRSKGTIPCLRRRDNHAIYLETHLVQALQGASLPSVQLALTCDTLQFDRTLWTTTYVFFTNYFPRRIHDVIVIELNISS
jgi:hypothetical protein